MGGYGVEPPKHMNRERNFEKMRGNNVANDKTLGVWHQKARRKTKIPTKINEEMKKGNP